LGVHYRKLIRQRKLPHGAKTALVYGAGFHLWEDANALDCDPRVEPKANASYDAERSQIWQGVPVNWSAAEGNRCRPIHHGAPAFGSRCKKVRRRRRMDAESALGRVTLNSRLKRSHWSPLTRPAEVIATMAATNKCLALGHKAAYPSHIVQNQPLSDAARYVQDRARLLAGADSYR